MEEDIRKEGILFLQQRHFGSKKWKRVWCVLYRESIESCSRLEYYSYKDGGTTEEKDKHQKNKKVIHLSDSVRVLDVVVDGRPRETGTFLVETTEKEYVFASDRAHLADWTLQLSNKHKHTHETDLGDLRNQVEKLIQLQERELERSNKTLIDSDTRKSDIKRIQDLQDLHTQVLKLTIQQKRREQQHEPTQDLEDLRNQVEKLTVQLQERERELENINKTLIEKDQLLKQMESEREKIMIEKDKSLEEKDQELKKIKIDIKQIQDQQDLQDLKERESELQHTIKQMTKSNNQQHEPTQDLEDLRNQVEKITVQLQERERELENINKTLIEKDQLLKQREGELEKITIEKDKSLEEKDQELKEIKIGSSTTKQIQIGEAEKYLKTVRTELIDRVSVPILNSLMDRLLTKEVINDGEMDSVRVKLDKSEKAREIIDMVRKKGNQASSEMIDILQQLDPNLSEHMHGYYTTYEQAKAQAKKTIQRDSEDRKEQEMRERFEKELKKSLREKDETIQELKRKISEIEYQLAELEKQLREERDEEKKRELEQKLRMESESREEMERKLEKFKAERENEKREMEARHRQEIDEKKEIYEGDARAEAERHLMKIILPEIVSNIVTSRTRMQREFERQLEEKNREMKELEERLKLCSVLKEEMQNLLDKQ